MHSPAKAFHCSSKSFGLDKSAIAPISRFRLRKGFASAEWEISRDFEVLLTLMQVVILFLSPAHAAL